MFPEGQRVAIVGNAPSLRSSGRGNWIDAHDVVVRFNECALLGHETDVGHRTDILISNPYAEKRTRQILDGTSQPKIVLILNPQTRRGEKPIFEQWIGRLPVLFSYTPDLRMISRPRSDVSLTTGTYSLSLLDNLLKPRDLSILGFTMFLPGANYHYWTDEVPSGLAAHQPIEEAKIFIDIINALRANVTVGSDIGWASDRVAHKLKSTITVADLQANAH